MASSQALVILESERGEGRRGEVSRFPPSRSALFLLYGRSSLATHTQSTEKSLAGVFHNLAMSSDIHIYEETVPQYNPGIYNPNWHFNPPAESTGTRRISSTHLWLPNGKPKSLPKSRMKLLLCTNKGCFHKKYFIPWLLYAISGSPVWMILKFPE